MEDLESYVNAVSQKLRAALTEAGGQGQAITSALNECLASLTAADFWGQQNRALSNLIWDPNRDLLKLGSLQTHARVKPLGYAGDYVMLDRICREDVTDDAIGHAMDQFFQAQAAPHAVRNRYRMLADEIAARVKRRDGSHSKPLKVVSVGSGPAADIAWAAEELGTAWRDIEVVLVDIDPRALEFCRERLTAAFDNAHTENAHTNLHTIQANLGRLPRMRKVLDQLVDADLVYCAGYFDYLDDDKAVEMLRALRSCVSDDGELLVFNFNEHNPSRAYMEWFGNWYLTYRTTDSLQRLGERAAPAEAIEVGVEPAGVNLYLRIGTKT